jgi:hypothetical protein
MAAQLNTTSGSRRPPLTEHGRARRSRLERAMNIGHIVERRGPMQRNSHGAARNHAEKFARHFFEIRAFRRIRMERRAVAKRSLC